MIEIQVLNLENLIPPEIEAQFSEDNILEILKDVVEGARDYWVKLAMDRFNTTKTQYVEGIQAIEWQGNDTAVISLVGVLPNILEQGMGRIDMHDTLLGPDVPSVPLGQKGKHPRKKGGYYRAIPFRHYTPGAGAHGQTMASVLNKVVGSELGGELAKDVYRAAKNLSPTLTDPYTGKTSWGERLDTANILAAKTRERIHIPKLKPYHAVDPFKGMVRMEKTYEKATQSHYMTFRTISVDGEGMGVGSSPWVRQATVGANLAKEVANHVSTRLAPQAFQAYVKNL